MTYCNSCTPTDARYFTNGNVSTASKIVLRASSPVEAVPSVLDPFPPLIIWLKGVYSSCESELEDWESWSSLASELSEEVRMLGGPGEGLGDEVPDLMLRDGETVVGDA